jgi:PAS domain S-box-containing protein
MLKFYFNKRIIVAFILALAILAWLAFAAFLNNRKIIKAGDTVAHTLDVLLNTERLFSSITNIELGQRGYTITQNKEFLKPYSKAKLDIDSALNNLKTLTTDNSSQQVRITSLSEKVNELFNFSKQVVDIGERDTKAAQAMNASLTGKYLMDDIRLSIEAIEKEENRLLKLRYHQTQVQLENFNTNFIALLFTTGLIVIVIFVTINLNLGARIEADRKLKQAMTDVTDLYDNAPCGYHSLNEKGVFVNVNNTLATWLGYSKEEMIGREFSEFLPASEVPIYKLHYPDFVNRGRVTDVEFPMQCRDGSELPVSVSAVAIRDEQGNFIKSRSIIFDNRDRKSAETKIKNLNTELEAFTYSVSHDLRAPLRSIDGYTKILEEDYADKLDGEAKRIIGIVLRNVKKMGKLIDDLLDFARLGRKELLRTNVDMSNVVTAVIADEVETQKANVKINTVSLLPCLGDVDMIRQVWQNLVSNAIKYSSKNTNAVIEIASTENDEEIIYWVKDNGVGFDMSYAPKLFNVFQRLHKMEEFGGTGVGLAIVKRVIDRHHGRVWAEAKLNEGATFYFTIPNDNGK